MRKQLWSNKPEFVLSIIGYSMGVKSVWRLPGLLAQNGGVAFLIPYLFFVFAFGIPLVILEVITGQCSNLSVIKIFDFAPLLQGVGWTSSLVSILFTCYHNTVLVWTAYYLFSSFFAVLPWSTCDNSWNNNYTCFTRQENLTLESQNMSTIHGEISSSAEQFWRIKVLGQSQGFFQFGSIQLHLLACLAIIWLLCYMFTARGVKSIGKVMWFIVIGSVTFFCVLIVRGLTLEGAVDALEFYLRPDWKLLLNYKVWVEAAIQVFMTFGLGWGVMISVASHNPNEYKFIRKVMIGCCVACLGNLLFALAIFPMLGHSARISSTGPLRTSGLANMSMQEASLVFVTYSEALERIPHCQIWSAIFYLSILLIGLGAQILVMQSVIDSIKDLLRVRDKFDAILPIAYCLIGFAINCIFITNAGFYYFNLVDRFSIVIPVAVVALIECPAFFVALNDAALIRFTEKIIEGKFCKGYLYCAWLVLAPISLLTVIGGSIARLKATHMTTNESPYPLLIGCVLLVLACVPIPFAAIRRLVRLRFELKHRYWARVKQSTNLWNECELMIQNQMSTRRATRTNAHALFR